MVRVAWSFFVIRSYVVHLGAVPNAEALAALVGARISAMRGTVPVRVAIDGRSTAGKTLFAEALARHLRSAGCPVVQASIDDFHTPGHRDRSGREEYTPETYYDTAFDYARFRAWVLDPLGPHGDRVVRRRYWIAYDDRPAGDAAEVVPGDVVLLAEGAFLLRPEFDDCWDLTVWLHVEFDTMVQRAVERDTWVGDREAVRRRYTNRYIALHRLYEQRTGAEQRADVMIDNNNPEDAQILRQPATWVSPG